MKKIILNTIAATFLLITLTGSLSAQSTIRGFVKSGTDGIPMAGVTIFIKNTTIGTITDASGNYFLGVASGVPYTVIASYVGYSPIERTLTPDPGDNWMNFWFNPPALPSDFDGNYYHTVVIGTQTWMVENLKVTHFRNGTNIPNVTNNTSWGNLTSSGYCWYDNDATAYKDTYGALYIWYSCNTGNLCPTGWHVSSDAEWTTLTDYLGGLSVAGSKLKESGTAHWNIPNTGATNESGFTALPGGYRYIDGSFFNSANNACWWTSSEYVATIAWYRGMGYDKGSVDAGANPEKHGFSVRCVNDPPSATISGTTTVCMGAAPPNIIFTGITGTAPYTFTYKINSGTNQNITTTSGNSVTISVPTGAPSVYTYSLVSVQDAYSTMAQTGSATVTVRPANTITLTSAGSTTSQTVCVNTAITPITYTTTGATGSTFNGLPAGVTGIWASNAVTISGTPTASGTFNYIVTPTGGCGTVTASGTITGNALPTATNTSATAVASVSATLNGIVNANNASADVTFEYGTSLSYGNSVVATPSPVTGTIDTFVSAKLTALTANTTYHYRVKAVNSGCTIYGSDLTFTTPARVSDADGYSYNTLILGTQTWMQENLKTTKYSDGTPVLNGLNAGDYRREPAPKYYFSYNDEDANIATYGRYYTWYAATDTRNVCPTGWHVPIQSDWNDLINYLISNGYGFEGTNHVGKSAASTSGWLPDPTHGNVGNDAALNNSSGFNGQPGGNRNFMYNNPSDKYYGMGIYGRFHSANELDSTTSYTGKLDGNSPDLTDWADAKKHGFNIRCLKGDMSAIIYMPTLTTTAISGITTTSVLSGGNVATDGGGAVTARGVCWSTSLTPTVDLPTKTADGSGVGTFSSSINGLTPGTVYYVRAYATNSAGTGYGSQFKITTYQADAVTDIDGNYYNRVNIGSQVWLSENLKVQHYRNGDAIPNATDWAALGSSTNGAYCNYGNDPSNGKLYGRLYNAYATVDNRNLCPTGWHVPTEKEWVNLENYLIANGYNYDGSTSGNRIAKAMASGTGWQMSDVTGAVGNTDYPAYRNKSGFSGLPGGFVYPVPGFQMINAGTVWWSITEKDPSLTITYSLWSDWVNGTHNDGDLKVFGFSVRCLQGEPIVVTNVNDSGDGSLRSALENANSNPGPDIIKFNISGTGPFTIKPGSVLPTVNEQVVIDGYTQPGSSSATSTLLIQLDGTSAGAGSNGLTINAGNCTVEGLVINKFPGNGIQITSGTGNWIRANSIYNNGGPGIVLTNGANNNQSFPVLDKTVISLGNIYIDGTLNGIPGKDFNLDFFASKLADNSGFGEGQTYLGSTTVTTGTDGVATFKDKIFAYKTIYGDVITATATDRDRNTSQFSKAIGGLPDQTLNSIGLVYHVNPNDARIDTGAISAAVKSSFNTWNSIPTASIAFDYGGTTIEKHAHIDGENVVSFSDDQYEFGDWVLAITAKTLELGATDAETKILDADIIFNPYFVKHQVWNFGIADDMANRGYFDIQSITTHEIGHILGLLHSGVHNATMWFEMGQGIDARSLEQDDRSWASYKYPKLPDYNNTFGSISGNIKYGYDNNPPVAGAIVLAINTATKDTVHSYSDALGNYLVPGLRAGSYNVYIEPLDGDVYGRPLTPRNISLYIYTNTIYTDYPGEFYSGVNEKDVESTDIVTPVSVNAGSATSNINFITNKDVTPPVVVTVTPPDLSISQDILIKFSEPVDIKTFTGTTCYLVKSGVSGSIGGTYTILGSQTNIVLYTPSEALNYNTSYTLHITTGVADLAKVPNKLATEYQFNFKTGKGDKTPPTIISMIPKGGAVNVFVTTKIQLFFSEAMNTASVTSSFTLTWYKSGVVTNVQGSSSWDPEYKTMTFSPTGNLNEATTYNVKVSTGAKDISGNAMKSSYSSTFTTVLVANPTLLYLEPGTKLKTEVTVETPVVADFSEPINPNTVDLNSFKLYKGATSGIPVNGKFEFINANSRVVFRPDAALDFSQSYTIALTTGIKDVSSPNAGTFQGQIATFKTAAKLTTPVINFISPPSGVIGDTIIIGGKGFDPDPVKDKVEFYVDGVTFVQAKVKSASLSSLKVAVPVGAKSGRINVYVNGNPADYLSPFDFYVVQKYSDPCNTVTGSAQTGGNSHAVALDITAATAYVTNSGTNNVSVIDVASMTVTKTINVGEYPLMIDINPSGTRAYVTNFLSHTVSVIDLKTNTVTKTIDVGYNPYGIKVSPDGKRVYVAHYNSDYENVSVIDADPASGGFDHVVADINTGTRNKNLDVDANATTMIVTGDDGVKIIEIIKTELGFDYGTYSSTSGIKTNSGAIISEAGLAVVSTMDGALLFIDINKGSDTFGAVISKSTSGGLAGNVQPDVSGVFLYVSNPYDNQVTVYKMTYGAGGSGIESTGGITLTEISKIPVGMSPQGMAINTFDNELYVVNEFGTTGSNGSVTKVTICCVARSISDDIVAVALYIQGLINEGVINEKDGKMLIKKLNDALDDFSKGKTKDVINDLNTVINKVSSSVKTGKIPKVPGQKIIDDVNSIIAKLNGAKSGEIDSVISYAGLSKRVQESESILQSRIWQIYPNPFSQSITINYQVAENKENLNNVIIKVYDMNGQLVTTLADEMMQAGSYTVTWDGTNENGSHAPYGTYIVLFKAGNAEEVRKIVLVKPR